MYFLVLFLPLLWNILGVLIAITFFFKFITILNVSKHSFHEFSGLIDKNLLTTKQFIVSAL